MSRNSIPVDKFPHNIQALFFKRFKARVPAISLKSNFELRERGVYAMGEDEEQTRVRNNEYVDTNISISKMFDIWKAGYRPQVVNASDCVEIFNVITNHLQQWVGYLNNGIQVADAPFEELIELDRFADVVYEHARFERSKRGMDYFENMFKNSSGFNLNPMMQFGESLTFIPLDQSDGKNMFYKPDNYAKEERQTFSDELSRLGGRMSQGVKNAERESIFSQIDISKR